MALLSIEHMERERAQADEALGPWLRLVVDQLDWPHSQECIKYRGFQHLHHFQKKGKKNLFYAKVDNCNLAILGP